MLDSARGTGKEPTVHSIPEHELGLSSATTMSVLAPGCVGQASEYANTVMAIGQILKIRPCALLLLQCFVTEREATHSRKSTGLLEKKNRLARSSVF